MSQVTQPVILNSTGLNIVSKLNIISDILSNKKKSLLPIEYQEVDYIQSTGTQYIDTGIVPTTNTEVIFKGRIMALLPASNNADILCGVRSQSAGHNARYMPCSINGTIKSYRSVYGTGGATGNFTYEEEHYIDINNDYSQIVIDENISTSITNTFIPSSNHLCMFASGDDNSTPSYYSIGRIYYCKIIDKSSDILREFIPCYRKSDNVAGMYDLVNNIFYINNGTGTFIIGPKSKKSNNRYDRTIVWNDALSCNWDFSNPVNTRGSNSYSSTGSVVSSIDGWTIQDGQVELVSGGLKLTRTNINNFGFFMQRFYSNITNTMTGQVITYSALIGNEFGSETITLTSGQGGKGNGFLLGHSGVRIYRYNNNEIALTIDIYPDSPNDLIRAFKLEAGNTQTLVHNEGTSENPIWVLNNSMNANTEYIKARNGTIYN